jgi:hypothetical protein
MAALPKKILSRHDSLHFPSALRHLHLLLFKTPSEAKVYGSGKGVVTRRGSGILIPVNRLTKQEQMFVCAVILILLTGWTVKAWRAAHPAPKTIQARF